MDIKQRPLWRSSSFALQPAEQALAEIHPVKEELS